MARVTIKRQKERELKYDLRLMRDAMTVKDGADAAIFRRTDSYGYPKTLDVLVKAWR